MSTEYKPGDKIHVEFTVGEPNRCLKPTHLSALASSHGQYNIVQSDIVKHIPRKLEARVGSTFKYVDGTTICTIEAILPKSGNWVYSWPKGRMESVIMRQNQHEHTILTEGPL